MEIGKKVFQMRKLSGMTQEQMAEKLHVARQTISKWESGTTLPDLERVVRLCHLFQVSPNELLDMGEREAGKQEERITLEDMVRINQANRRMTLLLTGGLLFLMASILTVLFVLAMRSMTLSTQYMLYRYIVTGQYENAPVNYGKLFLTPIVLGLTGVVLCICYLYKSSKNRGGH